MKNYPWRWTVVTPMLLALLAFLYAGGMSIAAQAQAARTVKIGVLNPVSGGLAIFGQWENQGIELYFNNHEIEGVNVELVFADTAGNPQQALDQARRLIDREKVDFLMGTVNSAVSVPLAQFADEAEVPLLIVIAGARAVTGEGRSPFVFRVAMANGQQERPLGWYVGEKLGLKRAAPFAWNFLVGEERAGMFIDAFTAAGGTIATQQMPPLGTTDYGPFIGRVDPNRVDVIYAFFAGPGAIAFMQQLQEFGLTPRLQVVADGYFSTGVLGAMSETALGLVQASQYVSSLDNPANRRFLVLFSAQIGGEPNMYIEEGYLGGEVAARAIQAVKGDLSDTQAFLSALARLEFIGTSGPFRFDDNGQSVRNIYLTEVVRAEDGGIRQKLIDIISNVSQNWTPPEG
ncbi:MAG: ABC transporter substrate-binding protein [Candidatus Bipolaricaulia bacterium]